MATLDREGKKRVLEGREEESEGRGEESGEIYMIEI